jgi:hypothetical protein
VTYHWCDICACLFIIQRSGLLMLRHSEASTSSLFICAVFKQVIMGTSCSQRYVDPKGRNTDTALLPMFLYSLLTPIQNEVPICQLWHALRSSVIHLEDSIPTADIFHHNVHTSLCHDRKPLPCLLVKRNCVVFIHPRHMWEHCMSSHWALYTSLCYLSHDQLLTSFYHYYCMSVALHIHAFE